MNEEKESAKLDEHIGCDYSGGTANFNQETGIHYGIISQDTVGSVWYEKAMPDYGFARCPECYEMAYDCTDEDAPDWVEGDYYCAECHERNGTTGYESGQCFPDQAFGYSYEDKNYDLESCLDTDICVKKSPYFTYAQYCSPCIPGAGDLEHPVKYGVKTYCLGHEWFENGKAPYPVYNVNTEELVLS